MTLTVQHHPDRLVVPFDGELTSGCLREGAKSYVKRFDARYGALDCVCASRKGIHPTRHRIRRRAEGVATEGWRGVAVQPARTFSPCSRNWPAGPTYR